MKDEFLHKISLFKKYLGTMKEETLAKRLGLKKWEHEYIRNKLVREGFIKSKANI